MVEGGKDEVPIVTTLRLDFHCFLCQKPAVKVYQESKSLPVDRGTWKQGCAEVISQSLGIGNKPICTVLFKRASYCAACYELFCDLDFIQRSIQRLEKRMFESSEKLETLIRTNFEALTATGNKTGGEYFNAVRTIGRELGLEVEDIHNKGTLSCSQQDEDNNGNFILLNARFLPSSLAELEHDESIGDCVTDEGITQDPLANDDPLPSSHCSRLGTSSPLNSLIITPMVHASAPTQTAEVKTKRLCVIRRMTESQTVTQSSKLRRLQTRGRFPVAASEVAAISSKFRRLAPLPSQQPQLPGAGLLMPLSPPPLSVSPKEAPRSVKKQFQHIGDNISCEDIAEDIAEDDPLASEDPLPTTGCSNLGKTSTSMDRTSFPTHASVVSANRGLAIPTISEPRKVPQPSKRKRFQRRAQIPVSASELSAISSRFRPLAPLPLQQLQLLPGVLMPIHPPPLPPDKSASSSVKPQTDLPLVGLETSVTPISSVTARHTGPEATSVGNVSEFFIEPPVPPPVSSSSISTTTPATVTAPSLSASQLMSGSCFPTLLWIPGPMGGTLLQVASGAVTNHVSVNKPEVIDISDEGGVGVNSDDLSCTVAEDQGANGRRSTLRPYNHTRNLKKSSTSIDGASAEATGVKRLSKSKRRPLNSLSCPQCKFRAGNRFPQVLQVHIRKMHENDTTPYHCVECDRRFSRSSRLARHKSAEHSEPFPCPHCPNKMFKGNSNLQQHLKIKHRPEVNSKCHFCTKICSEVSLRDHEALHEGWNPGSTAFSCVLCDSVLPTDIQLRRHVFHSHEDEYRRHQCNLCDKKFITREALTIHSRCHAEPQFKCTVAGCTYATPQAKSLRVHKISHLREKSFQCTWNNCGAKFKAKSTLTRHTTVHKLEEGLIEAKHTCSICSKGFADTSTYLRHMLSESEFRPFLCDKCPLRFKEQQSFNAHLWRHARNEGEFGNDTEARRQRAARYSRGTLNQLEGNSRECAVCGDIKNIDVVEIGAAVCRNCRWFFEYQNRINLIPSMVKRRKHEPCLVGNCVMTPETRSGCKDCRLKKCHAVGLTLKDCLKLTRAPRGFEDRRNRKSAGEDPVSSDANAAAIPERTCPVCEKSTRLVVSYGIHACQNCKTFFAGANRHKRIFTCYCNDDCQVDGVDWTSKDSCRSCRYRKCVEAGMKSDAVSTYTSENVGICPVCEEQAELRSTYGVGACQKCCHNFWVMVRSDTAKPCRPNCKAHATCQGCKWKKYIRLGFKVEVILQSMTNRVYKSKTAKGTPDNCWICGDSGRHRRGTGWACTSCVVFFDKFTHKQRENEVTCAKGGSCEMTILTRTDCMACRYQKCLQMGLRRTAPYKRRKPERAKEYCSICGDIAVGFRYGVQSCDSCMFFFMKAADKDFGNCQQAGGRQCTIAKETRSKCQPCRLAKCLEEGMEKTNLAERERDGKVRWGRIPRNSAMAEFLRKSQSQPSSTFVGNASVSSSVQVEVTVPSCSPGAEDMPESSGSDGVHLINVPIW